MAEDLGDQALAEEEALGHSMAMAEALTDALAQLDTSAPAVPHWTVAT
jgi:hypothetical protein